MALENKLRATLMLMRFYAHFKFQQALRPRGLDLELETLRMRRGHTPLLVFHQAPNSPGHTLHIRVTQQHFQYHKL
jgi:hypothetical protein